MPTLKQQRLARYYGRRYMEHLTAEQLGQRLSHLSDNAIRLSPSGERSFRTFGHWIDLWSDIEEEYRLRGLKMPDYRDVLEHRRSIWAERAAAVRERDALFLAQLSGSYLFRYGEAEFIRKAHERGGIRMKAASSYDDPSLNPAIRDNELEIELEFLPGEFGIQVQDKTTGEWRDLVPVGAAKATYSTGDYYVYCLSRTYGPRLFDAFEPQSQYDACLVIKDVPAFIESVSSAINRSGQKIRSGKAGLVSYIDPLNPSGWEPDVVGCKHFRFAYQQEYRITATPGSNEVLKSIDLDLGDISGFTEAIYL
jgi:hypothetical protein